MTFRCNPDEGDMEIMEIAAKFERAWRSSSNHPLRKLRGERMGELGTPDCGQCKVQRAMAETMAGEMLTTNIDDWEPEPCINLKNDVGDLRVSTVFLHHDHGFGSGEHVFYETMVFLDGADGSDQYCERYTSKAAAIAGHAQVLAKAKADGLAAFTDQSPDEIRAHYAQVRASGREIMRAYRERADRGDGASDKE